MSNGITGASITAVALDANGHLIITITDYSTDPAGLTYNVDVGSTIGNTGPTGATGPQGATGVPGATGVTGAYITNATVVGTGNLIFTLSSGVTFNAGSVVGPTGPMGATSTCPSCVDPLGGTGGTAYGCADLINIEKLVLSDTFQTWYDRTNQIIDAVNPINMYEIAGLTGIEIITGRSNCNYNGVVGVAIANGPGLTYGTTTTGIYNRRLFVDPASMPLVSGIFSVANNDMFIFNDVSDTTNVNTGTPKAVLAEYMVPPRLTFDELELNGDIVINGNFTIVGSQSSVGTNDVVIESKNLNLAYQRSALMTITGPSAAIQQLYQIGIIGASAFYDDSASSPGTTAGTIGVVKSITGPQNGLTAQVSVGSIFTSGNPDDFQIGGTIRFVSVTGTTFSLLSADGSTTNFFSDADLDGAGIIIKGLSGDKYFTWENCSNAWISNTNLGVDNVGFITSRNFRNVCIAGDQKNEFNFYGVSGQSGHTTLRLGHDQYGKWMWSHAHNLDGSPLLLKYASTTASTEEHTLATIYGLTTGPYNFISVGGTANMWAQGFNSDFLDGAGATTGTPYGNIGEPNEGISGSVAYSIPISDSRGKINANWLESDSNRIRVYQTGHGLTNGNCIIRTLGDVMGPTSAYYSVASPYSTNLSETVGIVVEVINSNEFVYVNSGLATIPVPPDILPGVSLLLGPNGSLTSDIGDQSSYIEKPMFMPVAITGSIGNRKATGIVLSQAGFLVGGDVTDQIYARGLVPVGTIIPYSGNLSNLPSGVWLPCDGKSVRPGLYPELYAVIGVTAGTTEDQKYYADVKVTTTASQNFTDEDGTISGLEDSIASMYIKGGTRGFAAGNNPILEQGDLVKLAVYSKISKSVVANRDARIWSINGPYELTIAFRVSVVQDGYTRDQFVEFLNTVKSDKNYSIRLYGRHRTDALSLWGTTLLPDIRSRTIYGSGPGGSEYDNGSQMVAGDLVNSLGYSIGEDGYPKPLGGDEYGSLTGNNGVTGYSYTPGIVTNYVIRATPEINALIISGHNHDDRYVRLDVSPQQELHVSGTTATNRANARYNIQALSRETGDTHVGEFGITFNSLGQYNFYSATSGDVSASVKIENPYGWSKLVMSGVTGGYIDIKSSNRSDYDLRIIGGYSADGYTGNQTWLISGIGNDLKLVVDGNTGVSRETGIYVKSGTGSARGNVGIKTDSPTLSLEVRGSGVKLGPSLYSGNTTNPAPSWEEIPTEGMFQGGMFNTTGLTTISIDFTINSSTFPNSPSGVYTVDPGTGIVISSGKTVIIETGYTWKII
jgi:hypothetical protein